MCIVFVQYDSNGLNIGANREEDWVRPFQGPCLHNGHFIAGQDRGLAGTFDQIGTWFGINAHRCFVAVTNRHDGSRYGCPKPEKSRGLLCVDLLAHKTPQEAALACFDTLSTQKYGPCNYFLGSVDDLWVVEAPSPTAVSVKQLPLGTYILSNLCLNDPGDRRVHLMYEMLKAEEPSFFDLAAKTLSHPDIIKKWRESGTRCSSIATIPRQGSITVRHSIEPPTSADSYRDSFDLFPNA